MRSSNNKRWKFYVPMLALWLVMNTVVSAGSAKDPAAGLIADEQRASEEIPRARQQESDTAVILGDLLGTITVPQRAGKIFSDLYYRHEAEIHHILNENLFLVLQTIGLVADALPTLRLMSERNGELLLDSATYARANNLYEEFRGLAGPQLTADLEETRSYLDRRTTKKDSGEVLINLNE